MPAYGFTPGDLLKTVGEAIKADGERIDRALTNLEAIPLEIQHPRELRNILLPPTNLRKRALREGIRQVDAVIDLMRRHEKELSPEEQLRFISTQIGREQMVRRLAEMTRLGR